MSAASVTGAFILGGAVMFIVVEPFGWAAGDAPPKMDKTAYCEGFRDARRYTAANDDAFFADRMSKVHWLYGGCWTLTKPPVIEPGMFVGGADIEVDPDATQMPASVLTNDIFRNSPVVLP